MYNWNTDLSKFKSAEAKKIWQLIQMLEYGTRGEKISRIELIQYWPQIKDHLDPAVKRLIEYVIWGKLSLLPTSNSFWIDSSQLQKLQMPST